MTYRKFAQITLVLVYLVIAAGAIVRMTGSGMGCPDWPKCFGYLIPPTQESELIWTPGKEYKTGQVIIQDEALLVASRDFTSTDSLSPDNWEPYDRHDYATFNVYHTWTEYINRLLGALAGLATLILAIWSLKFRKTDLWITIVSFLTLFSMGFQGWLGATVVYSVLAPAKITIHMIMALVIVGMIIWLIHESGKSKTDTGHDRLLATFILVALGLTLIQIVMGTQVREFVDEQIKYLGDSASSQWLSTPAMNFYVHRSFSIIVLLTNIILWRHIRKRGYTYPKIKWVMAILVAEIATGIAMNYFAFPFGSQPLHLILAAVLFGIQGYLFLEIRTARKASISS